MRWTVLRLIVLLFLAGIFVSAGAPSFATEPAQDPAPPKTQRKLDLTLPSQALEKNEPCHVQFGSLPKVPGYLVSSVIQVEQKLAVQFQRDDLPHEAKRLKEKIQQLSDTFRWNVAHGQVSLEHQAENGGTVSGIYYGHRTIMIQAKRKF